MGGLGEQALAQLARIGKLQTYDPSQFGTCIAIFLSGDQILFIGSTDDLPYYVNLMQKKFRLRSKECTKIAYLAVPDHRRKEITRALVNQYKPIMNRVRPVSHSDRRILRALGLL